MNSPFDPTPSIKIVNGEVVEMDGKTKDEFDMLDAFIARYAINLDFAEEAMATDSLEIARMLLQQLHLLSQQKSLVTSAYLKL